LKRIVQHSRRAALVAAILVAAGTAGADHLYWAEAGAPAIRRSNTDGTSTITLADFEMDSAEYLAIDVTARKVYWADNRLDNICRANLDGTGSEVLLETPDPKAIAVDPAGGKVYWTSELQGTLSRANLNGTGAEELHSGLAYPNGVAIDPILGRVFWTEAGTDMIRSSTLDGANIETLIAGLNNPIGLAAHPEAGWIFWTETGNERVARIDVDGGNFTILASAVSMYNLRGIAVDPVAERLFFTTDFILGKMYRMNFDGSDRTEVIDGESYGPIGVAADPVTGEFYWWHDGDRVFYRTNPLVAEDMTVTHAGLVFPKGIVHDTESDLLLWSDEHHIFRVASDGTAFRRAASNMDRVIEALAIDPASDKIYWLTDIAIYRSNYDGTAVEELDFGCTFQFPTAIAVDYVGGKIYWARINSALQRSNLDGSDCEELVIPGLNNPSALAFDTEAGLLYIGDAGTDQLLRYNVDTLELDPLVEPADNVFAIATGPNDQKIYWSQNYFVVKRANLADGSEVESIIINADAPRGLVTASTEVTAAPETDPEAQSSSALTWSIGVSPNPFYGATVIRLDLAAAESSVKVGIYDVSGRLVKSIHTGSLEAGTHQLDWDSRDTDGRRSAVGLYFVRVESAGRLEARKIVLLQ